MADEVPVTRRYYSLDIVRAVAALSVALGHMQAFVPESVPSVFGAVIAWFNVTLFRILSNGLENKTHPGVIVFIVLSGFCIHLPVAAKPERARRKGFWREYAIRRLTRIVPVYWAACVIGLAVLLMLLRRSADGVPYWSGTEPLTAFNIVRKFAFLDPLLPYFAVGLGNGAVRTVATELWLYALYPIVLYVVLPRATLGRTAMIVLLYGISIALALAPAGPAWAYESVPRFLVWWTMGAVAADVFRRQVDVGCRTRVNVTVCVVLLVALVVFNLLPRVRGAYLVSVPLLSAFTGSLLVSLMSLEHVGLLKAGPIVRLFAYVGERSYSLYAIHMPVLGIAYLCGSYGWWQRLTAVAGGNLVCTVMIAVATLALYGLVEGPSHRLSKGFSKRVPTTPEPAEAASSA